MSEDASANSALELLARHGRRLQEYLLEIVARQSAAPPRLMESIQYSLMAGGKRLRPALILECCHACMLANPQIHSGKAQTSALAAAAAMEFIHTFSLVHDDLPAMDDDDLRRGRPTNHRIFGEAMAVLAGDAMVTMAFEILATDADPKVAVQLIGELSRGAGPQGMIGGQVLDIEGEEKKLSLSELQQIHRMKTGALLTASCRLGAIAASASEGIMFAVTEFGRHLGLAFQIIDDVLDVTSTPEQMGKATGKDAASGKNTYPGLIGLEASQQEAERQLGLAIEAIASLGPGGQGLRDLARFVVERKA